MGKIKVSQNLTDLAKIFYPAPLFVTGGYVRNSLLNCPLSDIDLCSAVPSEKAEEMLCGTKFKIMASYNALGTLKIACGEESYEYTTLRKDRYLSGQHKPHSVEFCDDIAKDAKRRDFTVNAIYYDILNKTIADPLNGVNDLKSKIIKAHNPPEIFNADGLRLLRMVRFACQLGFEIEQNTFQEAKKYSRLLKDIKGERIFDELNKILLSDTKYPALKTRDAHFRGVMLLKELDLLPIIFPKIELCYGVKQREDFHKYDIFRHTAETVRYSHKSIRLAALLHDIGKGVNYRSAGNFYRHEESGAEIAKKLLGQQGLKCPNKLIDEVAFLIENHMYDVNGLTKDNKIKLFIAKNQKYLDKLLLLKQADYLGCGIKNDISPTVIKWLKIQKQMKDEGAPFSLKDLKINGNDVLKLGCREKYVKDVLAQLFKECVINPRLNDYGTLIKRAEKYSREFNKRGTL